MSRFFTCAFFYFIATTSFASIQTRNGAEDALNFFKTVYGTTYAPTDWKGEYAQWSLEKELNLARNKIAARGADLDVLSARRILMDFIYSMRDYHVSIRFVSTEASTLPLTIRSAEGRYFIVHIDTTKLNPKLYPFQVGDEVLKLNNRPVQEVVAELKSQTTENVNGTDAALAELNLTNRRRARGLTPEKGPVTLEVKSKSTGEIYSRQIIWNYTPEDVLVRPDRLVAKMKREDTRLAETALIPHFQMSSHLDRVTDNPHELGSRNSYLPKLGEPIWESAPSDYFQAYTYKNAAGKTIGVIRIRSYSFESDVFYNRAATSFSNIVNQMQESTDALVIDQLNNPGGSVFYLYALASSLSPQPLATPRHVMSITPAEVSQCVSTNKVLAQIQTDEEARMMVGEVIHGYPVSLQFVQFYRAYCQTFIEDWAKGQKMSRPFWIAGVDQINPAPNGAYTKPIMVLVNELDFSGGDFFPTILQDNKRATIFGVRTSGAGGYVHEFTFPNLLGIDVFRVTQSIAYRSSQNPIENLGVTPDIQHALTANDRQNNYVDYVKAVTAAADALVK